MKKFYEGDKNTLVVEHNGKFYPFHLKNRKEQSSSYKEQFKQYKVMPFIPMSWDDLTADGEQFVEVQS